ncbi:MAG: hydrogenase iron-sulfur subunit [Desulfohalobiaceae bacterium]
MPEKIGIYFDKVNLGQLLDLEALTEKLQNKWGQQCPVIKTEESLASEQGRKTIQEDIDSGAIDSACICGSSPRVDQELFDFGSKFLVERVNLREQCVKCYKEPEGSGQEAKEGPPQLLQALALDYINMAVAKLQKTEPPEPEILEVTRRILVLGGGWSGLHAALSCAKAGYEVVLLEKEKQLGGYAAKMHKTFPLEPPFTQVQDTGVEQLVQEVTENQQITVYTSSSLQEIAGQPGQYTARIQSGKEEQQEQVGSVVVATGWQAQDTKYLQPLGYGKYQNIVTAMQMEDMAKKGEIVRPSDGKKPGSVVFIQGFSHLLDEFAQQEQREKEEAQKAAEEQAQESEEPVIEEKFEVTESYRHLPYTSEITSLNVLKQAGYVRQMIPDSVAYIIYEHMMIPGINELYYKSAQDDPGIMLSKGEISSVYAEQNDQLVVRVENTLLGEDIEIEADLVVVPTGLVPTTALDPVVQLAYRQGQAFPDLNLFDGFADSNYICFPYETRRTGIYAAGTVRQPMTLAKSKADAHGAALKAIQCLESVNRGMAVHPRSGDLSFPKFNFVRCTQCKRCTEECPFGALDDDEKGTPKPNTGRCRRCGVCMGACPERVISFDNYSVGQVGSMITQIQVPEEIEDGGPRILILACENDAYPALDMAAMRGRKWSPYVRIIPVRCLGSVNTIWVADAMGKGNDGCLLLGCKYGDDYQCHFMKGSELCSRRMQNIGETLDRLGIEIERVRQEEVAIDDYDRLPDIIDNFVQEILQLGPNPFKGF